MQKEHDIPEDYLKQIRESQTRRHAQVVAGWLNNSHGYSRENRRTIQKEVGGWISTHKTGTKKLKNKLNIILS